MIFSNKSGFILETVFSYSYIIKQVALNKSSSFYKTHHINITTKLKRKLFTKVLESPEKEAWAQIYRV
jgi:hypothetical protein